MHYIHSDHSPKTYFDSPSHVRNPGSHAHEDSTTDECHNDDDDDDDDDDNDYYDNGHCYCLHFLNPPLVGP